MKKKISVLGLELDNISMKDTLSRLNAFIDSDGIQIVEMIFMELLISGGENEEVRQALESLDLSIIGDKEILAVAGITNRSRVKETEESEFVNHFLENLVSEKKKMFLLCNTDEECDIFKEYLQKYNYDSILAGMYSVEKCKSDFDVVLNEINILEPDVVFSAVESPVREDFILHQTGKVNTRLWFELGRNIKTVHATSNVTSWFREFINRKIFRREVLKYNNDENDN